MGADTEDASGYARKPSQTSDSNTTKSKEATKPSPKKSGAMFEAHDLRELVTPKKTLSTNKPAFTFDPALLEFHDSKEVEVRIYNDTEDTQTIDDWEIVGDAGAFTTEFVGARSVPVKPHASIAFRVRFSSEATTPQAAALIVRSIASDRFARLDLVGIQATEGGVVSPSKDRGIAIEAVTDDGHQNTVLGAMTSVHGALTAVSANQVFAISDLKAKMSAPEPSSWQDDMIVAALGFGLSEAIGAVSLFLGGGLALAAWNVVENKLHLGKAAAAAASKEIARVTLRVHGLVSSSLAQAASSKVGDEFLKRMTGANAKGSAQKQLRDAFFDAQAETLTKVYENSITALNNHEGDYTALEAQHPGFGFAALEAYRSHLYTQAAGVIAIQRNKTLGQWLSLLARLQAGVHTPTSKGAKTGSALNNDLYGKATDAHHRVEDLTNGVIELHGDWDYDRMTVSPFRLEHARVVGVQESVKELLTQAPLKAFTAPMLVYGRVIRQRPEGSVSHSHLRIARNESGTLWLQVKDDTDAADMVEMVGNKDRYVGAQTLMAYVDSLQLSKVD